MSYHQGRLIDHIHLHVADLERSKRFYRAVLDALGKADNFGSNEKCFYCDELYVDADDTVSTNTHLAFQAESKQVVEAFYRSGLESGGSDNGPPGYRDYHDSYYAAFLTDPDGNNIEAVCDVGSQRSAASILVTRKGSDT